MAEFHLYVHLVNEGDPRLDQILAALGGIQAREDTEMADLTALTAEVQQNGDAVQSAVTLLTNLSGMIRDMSTDPAALADLANSLDSQSTALAAAVAANTPAAP